MIDVKNKKGLRIKMAQRQNKRKNISKEGNKLNKRNSLNSFQKLKVSKYEDHNFKRL